MAASGAQSDPELIARLDEMERAGMTVTRQWYTIWRTAVQYLWGEQLQGVARNPDWDYIVVNYLYPLVMQGVAKLSKNQPKVITRSWKESETEWAERWQGLLQYVWEQVLNMRVDVVAAMLDGAVYGYAVGKVDWRPRVRWDTTKMAWVGDVGHRLVHPAGFWVDPKTERIQDAECLGTVRPVDVEWACNQWPDFADEIRAHADEPDELAGYEYSQGIPGLATGTDNGPVYGSQKALGSRIRGYWSRFAGLILGQESPDGTSTSDDGRSVKAKRVWVRETYFRDYETNHVRIEDNADKQSLIDKGTLVIDPEDPNQLIRWAETKEPVGPDEWPKVLRQEYDPPVYPFGRMVIRVGKVIVNPKPEQQVYRRSRWPFNVLPYHLLPHMWQGSNSVDMSRSSQDMLNVTVSYLLHHLKMAACPQKVIEDNTLAKDARGKTRIIRDRAGELIVVQKGKLNNIRNLENDRLDPAVWTLVQYFMQDLETQQFMHAVAQGKSSGNLSATEASRLDTNAHDLIYLRSIHLERWIEGTARCIAEVIQQYYDEGRRIRVIGWQGDTVNGEFSADMQRVEIDLEVEPGTTLPFDEERQKQDYLLAYKLCGDPAVNPMLEEVLRKLNIANRDKVLSKIRQLQVFRQFMALAAQAKQAAAALQPKPGPDGQMPDPARAQALQQTVQGQIVQKAMQLLAQAGQTGSPQQPAQPQIQGAAA